MQQICQNKHGIHSQNETEKMRNTWHLIRWEGIKYGKAGKKKKQRVLALAMEHMQVRPLAESMLYLKRCSTRNPWERGVQTGPVQGLGEDSGWKD